MEIKTDEIVEDSNKDLHIDFDRQQYIVELSVGQKVKIEVLDVDDTVLATKIYTAKYIDSHFNLQWQDKGIRTQ